MYSPSEKKHAVGVLSTAAFLQKRRNMTWVGMNKSLDANTVFWRDENSYVLVVRFATVRAFHQVYLAGYLIFFMNKDLKT